MSTDTRMPVVFFGHGSPTNALENNECTRAWHATAQRIGKPRGILSISAHWYGRGSRVTAMQRPPTIHDFGRSLPAPLFDLQYPAPGDPDLAGRVREVAADAADVSLDQDWGLDHGTWSVLLKAYPDADVPVVQLSIDASKPGAWHYELGKALRPLRDEGVLIMGTGNVVHNLGVMQWSDTAEPYDWATRFNDCVIGAIQEDEPDRLFEPQSLGRDANMSVPSMDHYLPLLYVLGARHADDALQIDAAHIVYRSLSMLSFTLGEA